MIQHGLEFRRDIIMNAAGKPRHHAQYAACVRDDIGKLSAFFPGKAIQRRYGGSLQGDAPGPIITQLAEHAPGLGCMRHVAVQMGTHRNRAMGISGTQREFSAHAHIGFRPIHVAIRHHGGDSAEETTIRIGGALPDMALIKMGIEDGATLVTGGLGRPEHLNRGYFAKPTIFGNVTRQMRIAQGTAQTQPGAVFQPFVKESLCSA